MLRVLLNVKSRESRLRSCGAASALAGAAAPGGAGPGSEPGASTARAWK